MAPRRRTLFYHKACGPKLSLERLVAFYLEGPSPFGTGPFLVVLHLTFRRVRPGQEDALRAWMAELGERADEVRTTFRQEGVRHEQAFLLPTPDGLVLIYAHEVDDPEAAHATHAQSSLPIDAEHRERMQQPSPKRSSPTCSTTSSCRPGP